MEALELQKDESGIFQMPEDRAIRMPIPAELIPKCPDDGSDMTMSMSMIPCDSRNSEK